MMKKISYFILMLLCCFSNIWDNAYKISVDKDATTTCQSQLHQIEVFDQTILNIPLVKKVLEMDSFFYPQAGYL